MAYNIETTKQHYTDAAAAQPPITGYFAQASHGGPPEDDGVAAVHKTTKAKEDEAIKYGVQAATGVEGANGGAQERSFQASLKETSGAHAREDEERRKARHADNAYILLMLQLDQLNEDIARMREEIEIFEQDFERRYGQSYAEYYAAKYLGEDFGPRRNGEDREAYSFRVAREIQKKIDKGEIVIDNAEDPLFEQGLKYYTDLERKHREVLEVKKELEPVLKQAELAGETSPEYKMALEKLKGYTPEVLYGLRSDEAELAGASIVEKISKENKEKVDLNLDFILASSPRETESAKIQNEAAQKNTEENSPPIIQQKHFPG